MGEPLSISSGIAGVIGLTMQLVQVIIQFGLDWRDAPKDVKNFMAELESLRATLLEIHTKFLLSREFAEAFQDRPSALLSQLGTDIPSTAETQLTLEACQEGLETLINELKKRARENRIGWERLKGVFLAKTTQKSIDRLHRQCQIFNSMVSIDSACLGVTTHNEVKKARKEQQEWHKAEQHQKILTWLSRLSFEDKQKDIFSKHHPGTGTWLLNLDKFKEWRDGDLGGPSILWCPGIPGAGKSVMTSIVVDHLKSLFVNQDVAISYAYCDYNDRKNQTTLSILSSLVKQFILQQSEMPSEAKELYSKHGDGQSSPSLDEYSMLLSSSSRFRKSFVVVDALDEHLNKDEEMELLSRLQEFRRQSGAATCCRLFLTSREILSIQYQLAGCTRIDIRASDSDIRSYLGARISDSKFRFVSNVRENADLGNAIMDKLVQSAQGMFLLPRLHVDHLRSQTSVGKLREALNHLPTKLEETYEDAMTRIRYQGEEDSRLALTALSWISNSLRPLRLDELRHALAIAPGSATLDKDLMPSELLLTSVSAGLSTVDVESRTIGLAHPTVKEFFKKTRPYWLCDGKRRAAEACLTYLSFDVFAEGYCLADAAWENRLRQNPFFDHAARNWGYYARGEAERSVRDLALKFLTDDSKVSGSSQMIFVSDYRYSGYSQTPPKQFSGLHMAAYFGLRDIMKVLLNKSIDVDSKDSYGRTPLSWAAENGHEVVVKLLLEKAIDIDSQDSNRGTPLTWAARNGHEAVVRLLIDKTVDRDSKDNSHYLTSLSWAAGNGHKAVVKLLLEKCIEVDFRGSEYGRIPLSWAAENGHEAVVELLLERSVDVDSKDSNYHRTPLSFAAENGHEAVVRLLLEKSADVDSKDSSYYRTPLSWAAEYGHEAVVRLLLEEAADVDSRDEHGQTPLSWAAEKGHEAVVKLLLEKTTNLDSKDSSYCRTPLSWAARNGHAAVVKLLLEKSVDVDAKDGEYGRTPLSWASEYGHQAVVKLLLEKPVDVDSKDIEYGRTPLSWAARNGREGVVKLLLEQPVDVDSKDKEYGRTPLSWAAWYGHEAVVKLLLQKPVDINSKDSEYGRTPLLWAVWHGYEAVVKLLLEKSVDVDSKDIYGWTPLSRAAEYGHEAVVRLLLTKDIDMDSKDSDYGRTPLSWAAWHGHKTVVELLLQKAADTESEMS